MSRVGLAGRVLAVLVTLAAAALPIAFATPALPSSAVASQAVRSALSVPARVSAAIKVPAAIKVSGAIKPNSAASTRAQGVSRAASSTALRSTGRSALLHSTAYNSTPGQTDSTPYITATGTRVRVGVVALSRDLLGRFPYGTRITIEDLSGRYSNFLHGRVFVVEDTMHPRIGNTVDVWMGSRGEAMAWGSRSVRITVVQ